MAKGGEGSRGGTVIGHTKSGKPIYKEGKHRSHVSFDEQDHKDAADLHHKITEKASQRLEEKRTQNNNFSPKDAKGVQEFLNHHYKTMTHHQLKANAKLNEREDREGKTRSRKNPSKPEAGSATKPNKDDTKKDQILKELYKEVLRREKEKKDKVKKAHDLLNVLKGGPGSGKRGHQSEGLSDRDLHSRREKFAGSQYAKFRNHSGEGLNDADKFKHGMVQDAKKFGYLKKNEELDKSGYEGYTSSDNARRKANNIETGQSTGGAVGRRTKAYGGSGPSAASKEAAEMRRRSKKNPVKVFSKEEIAALNAELSGASEKHGRGPDKGPRKSRVAKALEMLEKGRALPVGTQRTWKGQDYIKHASGWVYAGGKHTGKLVGKTKGEASHTSHVDQHHKPGATTEEKKSKKKEEPKKKIESKTEHYKLARKTEILLAGLGKPVTFEGPGGKEYAGEIYGQPDDGKILLKFPGVGFRNIPISSMNNIAVDEPKAVVAPSGELPKGKSLGWPPVGFKEPERKNNKTRSAKWYDQGNNAKNGRPSTKGKPSAKKTEYKSPDGSNCNLVGKVAFGKASVKAQAELNQRLQMTEVLLTDMGIKMKTPIDFMCQDMSSARTGVMAQFIPRQGHSNDKINLVKNLKTANKSILHEIGHGIDYAMEQKGLSGSYFRGNPTQFKEEIEELTQVLKESRFYEATGAKDAPGNADDTFLEPDNRYAKYLKDQSEVFARAFEVYTYSHALDMVSEGKLPAEYTENIVPDFLRAGFSQRLESNPDKVDEVIDKVTEVMDRIFANRAIQKAIQEVDLFEVLRKNVIPTDDQGSATETGMYSNDLYSNASNPLLGIIKDALEDHDFGMDPVQVIIAPGTVLTATKVDDGVYSGHVTREKDGEVENVLKIEKQTLPTLLQFLKVKELIPMEVQEPESGDMGTELKVKMLDLLGKLI